jgi:hypothetical protein
MTATIAYRVRCHECGDWHPAEFSHVGGYSRPVDVYAVVCTVDGLTDYYTTDGVEAVTS